MLSAFACPAYEAERQVRHHILVNEHDPATVQAARRLQATDSSNKNWVRFAKVSRPVLSAFS
jgi:hypothetical protein